MRACLKNNEKERKEDREIERKKERKERERKKLKGYAFILQGLLSDNVF